MEPTTKKTLKIAGAVSGGIVLIAGALVGNLLIKFFHVEEQRIDDKLVVFLGGGGNTAALITPKGVVLVDTKLGLGASRLFEGVEALHAGPVSTIINTHFHLDHTHGNPLAPAGVRVIAAAPVRDLLIQLDGDFWAKEPALSRLPNAPFTGEERLDFGDETLRLVQMPPAHTAADLVVLFEKRRILHTGDLFFNGLYPNIDRHPGGGSVAGLAKACDLALALPFDTVIPGHGKIAARADLVRARDYYLELSEYGKVAVAQKLTLADAVSKAPEGLRHFEPLTGITSLSGNIEAAMDEAAGK